MDLEGCWSFLSLMATKILESCNYVPTDQSDPLKSPQKEYLELRSLPTPTSCVATYLQIGKARVDIRGL